jgi:hypothetical protein
MREKLEINEQNIEIFVDFLEKVNEQTLYKLEDQAWRNT